MGQGWGAVCHRGLLLQAQVDSPNSVSVQPQIVLCQRRVTAHSQSRERRRRQELAAVHASWVVYDSPQAPQHHHRGTTGAQAGSRAARARVRRGPAQPAQDRAHKPPNRNSRTHSCVGYFAGRRPVKPSRCSRTNKSQHDPSAIREQPHPGHLRTHVATTQLRDSRYSHAARTAS